MKIDPIEYGRELGALSSWVPSKEVCQKILWDNPARFFGFTKSAKISDLSVKFESYPPRKPHFCIRPPVPQGNASPAAIKFIEALHFEQGLLDAV